MEKYFRPNKNISVLKKLRLSGFKSIATNEFAQTITFDDINIIIGPNGSGKTNLISFFKMLNHMMTGALQTYIGKNGTSENLLFFGSKKTPILSASLEFKNDSNIDIYDFSLVKSIQDTLIFSEERITWNGKNIPLSGGQRESFLLSNELEPAPRIVKSLLMKCRVFQFHDTSENSHIRNSGDINNNNYLFHDGGNVAAILYLLKNKKEYYAYYRRIVSFVRMVVPQFDDFVLEPQNLNENYIRLRWKQKGEAEYVFGAEQLSDGSLRFIALATLFLQHPDLLPRVIVIDEPELGLHPQAIDILATMMRMASKNAQVIVATQSARLLDSFSPEKIIIAEHDKQNNCSVYKRLSTEELSDWLEEYSLSELWEKNIFGGQP